jgi:hypothetical protein
MAAMYSRPSPNSKRESKELWCIQDNTIRKATGWSCAPGSPDYWWIPDLGFSGCVGVHCFFTQKHAKQVLRAQLLDALKKI